MIFYTVSLHFLWSPSALEMSFFKQSFDLPNRKNRNFPHPTLTSSFFCLNFARSVFNFWYQTVQKISLFAKNSLGTQFHLYFANFTIPANSASCLMLSLSRRYFSYTFREFRKLRKLCEFRKLSVLRILRNSRNSQTMFRVDLMFRELR